MLENKANVGWNCPHVIKTYFHNSDLQTRWALKCLSKYHFRCNEHILDFGSGDGKLTSILASFVPKGTVLGVDTSSGMVAFANRMFPQREYLNLSFQSFCDVTDLENALHFDLVTSFCVFQLVSNPKELFAKLYEQTRPGGKLLVTFPIGTNPAFTKAAQDLMRAVGLQKPERSVEATLIREPFHLRNVLTETGYRVDTLELVHVNHTFCSTLELTDWCEGTLSGNWKIPEEGRREFFEELVKLYLAYNNEACDEEGFVDFALDRIDFLATKA